MEETFQIPVMYRDESLLFTARLITRGYIHQFRVEVYEQEFLFEQDDNGEYRALTDPSLPEAAKKTDVNLLKAIAEAIEYLLK